MKNNGVIYSISGPVVIAEDLDGKMFDVVHVGNMGLIGEIIKIVGNRATIQVYEDTSGLRPGEPVESTGKPLSVELGPGLLKSIYDGIQRPLDIIKSETGDFIVRGATAPPLDEKKEWDFVSTMKESDEVEPGYIVGTVQETDLILHKIMVPDNVRGTISSIKSGSFKISDTVCIISDASGNRTEIKLKQTWPVRKPRKVFLKFAPELPLITGQRVIDSFFPVAKGGTVAVPGPFGSGKCVAGDTPVLLNNGEIKNIEDIYNEVKDNGIAVLSNENETLIKLNKPVNLFSFYENKVKKSTSDYIYTGKSDSLIYIRTESGREVKVTPVHKLFKLEDGAIKETEAMSLKKGDYIASIGRFNGDMESGIDNIISFLNDYYAGSGSLHNNVIELNSSSKKLQLQLSYLLTGLGIMHSLRTENIETGKIYKIYIENSSEFKEIFSISKIKNDDITIPAKFNVSIESTVEEGNTVMVHELLDEKYDDIFSDKIDEIYEISGPFNVYDVVTPEFGSNFVGGNGAILLHNTVIQHQLSKWSDADITVYVGCGERGNEMTEILTTFPELADPKSGKPLMEKTILIANTSNMPVAAREASIYTGVTVAEYYRDMGYDVALMADSTSRWAEALREISGRLEEMPGEEGYPAYLGRRISEFYERSGNAQIIPQDKRTGSITLIGAVSPPGGDLSDPVVQNTLRVTRVFWALDASLASRRHFPSINWLNSYSLYIDALSEWFKSHVSSDWIDTRSFMMGILQKESELQEIVQLVGYDSLPEKQKNILDIARLIREDFLQQNAFDDIDTYCSIKKQYGMLTIIKTVNDFQERAIDSGLKVTQTGTLPVRNKISRMKEVPEKDFDKFYNDIIKEIKNEYENIMEGAENVQNNL